MPHVAGDTSAHQEPASWRGQLMCSDTDRSTSVLATQCLQDQRDPPLSQSSSCHKILGHKAAIVTRLQIVTKPCCTGTWQVLLSSCRCRVGPTAHKLASCKSEAKDGSSCLACYMLSCACKGMQVLSTTCVMLFASQVQGWSHSTEDSKGQHGCSLQQESCPPAQGGCNNAT